jgi:prepilin-type N-terminal cleavage/methylation domain-containing protein
VRADSKGFTLLEMIISISLMALLMTTLLVGLRVAGRAWQRGEARLREVHVEEERDAFLATQLSSLVPYVVTSRNPDISGKVLILQATRSCLRFVSSYSSRYRNQAGLVLAEYAVVATSSGPLGLALREVPVRDDQALPGQLIERITQDEETGKTTVIYRPFSMKESDIKLMTGLERAGFEYLDLHPKDGSEPTWVSEWESTSDFPYPAAILLRWRKGGREAERLIPIRAQALPQP